ncbi:MAG: trimeric intracellular cation channel family protein [Clostridia bacterium]|nr:trimeric intracellular cation channel family protein [Clostridia bacterium]
MWTEIDVILLILEIIGTISFAVSGAFVAIKAKFDIFGVLVIGCITAVGGGIMRDILIGKVYPTIFDRWYIALVACASTLIVFLISYKQRKKFDGMRGRVEHINNIFDALGLAAFTVMGTELAFTYQLQENVFLSLVIGVISAVGGGVLRDILTETPPYIFTKHVYAMASIGGAILYYVLRLCMKSTIFPGILGMLFVFGVRMLATKYHWKLPKITLEENDREK